MGIKVFFNNSCNVCRLEINHYKKISGSNLEWVDITNNEEAIRLTSKSQKELLRRLHVIENGKVIEEGDHKTLLEKKGNYYKLYKQQIESEKSQYIS